MNENVNLMMKHMLRLAEAYEKLLKEVVQLRQESHNTERSER